MELIAGVIIALLAVVYVGAYMIAVAFLLTGLLFMLYVAIMGLERVNVNDTPALLVVLAIPWIVLGYILDGLFNLTIGTVLFVEFPRELLFSDRCARHAYQTKGGRVTAHRYKVARFFCERVLSPYDQSGDHCR